MHHFNQKSLIFYSVAISSVIGLFSLITAYGEAHLTPPPAIDGDYNLQINPYPNCPNPNRLVLSIQQSGIYLNAALLPANVQTSDQAPPALTLEGQWQQQRLHLTGHVPSLAICPQASSPPEQANQVAVAIEGTFSQATLKGQIRLNEMTEPLEFTAKR